MMFNRLHVHPAASSTSRYSRWIPWRILVAALAAGAILLIVLGLAAHPRSPGSQGSPDPARTMLAKDLEELELQQPFIERTLRPLAHRLSGACRGSPARRSARRPRSGSRWPATRATCASPTGSASRRSARSSARSCSSSCSCRRHPGLPVLIGSSCRRRRLFGYTIPEFWLGGGQEAPEGDPADDPGRPRPADDLRPAGLGFDAALGKVVEKLKGPLSDEFRRALAEVRVGKARRDALRDIVPRTEVVPLTNFIGAIIQAEQLGVSISKVLQVQSEQLRIERRQRAEEQAAKAPIKMLFPLVGCIFPSLFIVILGPAIILIVLNLKVGG
jgi:tight adherence protein C